MALLLAVEHRYVEVVELLPAQPEVDVNARNVDTEQPFFVAAALGDEKIACLLSEKTGIDLWIQNSSGVTPLDMAAHMGHEGMVKILLDKTLEVNLCPDDHSTPLISAIRSGHVNIVNLLLQDNRVDPNVTDSSPSTPIHHIEEMY